MVITTMHEILLTIAGSPMNQMEGLILYLGAVTMSLLLVFAVLRIFTLITNFFKNGGGE